MKISALKMLCKRLFKIRGRGDFTIEYRDSADDQAIELDNNLNTLADLNCKSSGILTIKD